MSASTCKHSHEDRHIHTHAIYRHMQKESKKDNIPLSHGTLKGQDHGKRWMPLFSITVVKNHGQKATWWEKGQLTIFVHHKRKSWSDTASWLGPHAWLSLLSYTIQDSPEWHHPWAGTSHSNYHQICLGLLRDNQENTHRLAYRQSESFSQLRFPLHRRP